jgi:hypothetical protein
MYAKWFLRLLAHQASTYKELKARKGTKSKIKNNEP